MANLPVEFNNFKASRSQAFSVSGAGTVVVDVACHVAIVQGSNSKITVEIDAEPGDLKDFRVKQQGNKIYVDQDGGDAISSTSVSFSGSGGTAESCSVSVSRGGSVSISTTSGRIIVNGREIEQESVHSASDRIPRILIKAPANCDLSAKLHKTSVLASTVPHNEAHLHLLGQSRAIISAHSLDLKASGQCDVEANVAGGQLSVDASGQCEVRARGQFDHVKVDLSGIGSVETDGVVRGDYAAGASGVSKIAHRGKVGGRVHKKAGGMASISIG